jgi:hypothetical protein
MTTPRIIAEEMGRRALLLAPLAAALLAGQAAAAAPLVEFSIVDRETGRTADVWRHGGRAFVVGAPGSRYGLRVTNNTGGRVLVVMSVDGINVLTGETAAHGQRGYIFGPYQTYDVTGWRKSDHEVAAFTYAALSKSYAARTGRPGDVGVIGIAVFTERPPTPAPAPAISSRSAEPRDDLSEVVVTGSRLKPERADGVGAQARAQVQAEAQTRARREEKLGTGHGAREWSTVRTVAFRRATRTPQLVRQIEYDTYGNLAALGVIPPRPVPGRRPRPFPGAGYVPDPPGLP